MKWKQSLKISSSFIILNLPVEVGLPNENVEFLCIKWRYPDKFYEILKEFEHSKERAFYKKKKDKLLNARG